MLDINSLYDLGVVKVDADRGLINVAKSIARKLDRCVTEDEKEKVYEQVLRVVSYDKSNIDSVIKMFVGNKETKDVIKSIEVVEKGFNEYRSLKVEDTFLKIIIVINSEENDSICVRKIFDVEKGIFNESCTLNINEGDIYAFPSNSNSFELKVPDTVKYLRVLFG